MIDACATLFHLLTAPFFCLFPQGMKDGSHLPPDVFPMACSHHISLLSIEVWRRLFLASTFV